MRQYLMKAIQDDARRPASETACTWRHSGPACHAARPRTPPPQSGAWPGCYFAGRPPSTAGPCAGRPHARGLHAAIEQAWHEVLVDDEAAAEQASPPLALNWTI